LISCCAKPRKRRPRGLSRTCKASRNRSFLGGVGAPARTGPAGRQAELPNPQAEPRTSLPAFQESRRFLVGASRAPASGACPLPTAKTTSGSGLDLTTSTSAWSSAAANRKLSVGGGTAHLPANRGRGRDEHRCSPPSRAGEFHPEALTEPCVTVSRHTARAILEGCLPPPQSVGSSRRRLTKLTMTRMARPFGLRTLLRFLATTGAAPRCGWFREACFH